VPDTRAALRFTSLLMVAVLYAPAVRADHCQPPGPLPRGAHGFRVALALEAAAYEYDATQGDYQGATLSASYAHDALKAELTLPAYRLTRDDSTFYGAGDATGELRVRLVQALGEALSAGAGITAMAPTGSASRDLGMGHFMLMPAVWGLFEHEAAFIQVQLAYARALSDEDDEHAGHTHDSARWRPIVRPMNTSELVASASAGYAVHPRWRVQGGVYTAVAVDTPDGQGRTVASLGVDFIPSAFDVSLEAQMPLAGDPFTIKVVAGAGVRF
jgi:hypothetical protein